MGPNSNDIEADFAVKVSPTGKAINSINKSK